MSEGRCLDDILQGYLDQVAEALNTAPVKQREMVLQDLRDHIAEAVNQRAGDRPPTPQDAYAVLAEMDPPAAFADAAGPGEADPRVSKRLAIVAATCGLLQFVGLVCIVAGVPVIPSVGGFAAVVSFLIQWVQGAPKWMLRLAAGAAVCGVVIIILELVAAL